MPFTLNDAAVSGLFVANVRVEDAAKTAVPSAIFTDEEIETHNRVREGRQKFLTKYPEFLDRERCEEALGDVTRLLIDNGFTTKELEGISDYRWVAISYELTKAIRDKKSH